MAFNDEVSQDSALTETTPSSNETSQNDTITKTEEVGPNSKKKTSNLSNAVSKYISHQRKPTDVELSHVLPKNYDPQFSSSENLRKYKARHEDLLKTYHESSEVYNHEQYGVLSEDDVSILIPDHDKKFYRKERILTHSSNFLTGSSSSDLSSSSKVSEVNANHDIEKNVSHETNPNLLLKFSLPSGSHEVVDFCGNRTHIPIRVRLRQRRNQIYEFWKDHKWKNWGLLIIVVILIIVLCFVVPVLVKFLDHPHGPVITVVEKITDYVYPQLSAIRQEMIDPDTPESAMTKLTKDGEVWDLVFSDEFNKVGRSFYPGMDQFWEAVDLHYAATNDLEWYDPDAINTKDGTLNIRMDAIEQHDLFYRSGMLQSWNKLCFTEGILEISARLPGSAHTGGLWPGLWLLGNLARPGYMASTDGVWPYTYNECDVGITANQSSSDGISFLPGQRLNKCTCKNEDHPNRGTGRGAPEIDILEGAHSRDISVGVASQTLQIAPFDVWYQPDYDFVEVYNQSKSNIGPFMGTVFQEMLSTSTTVNETWFQHVVNPDNSTITLEDRQTYFQSYGVEYQAFKKKKNDNYCTFLLGGEPISTVYGNALHPNGNVGWRDIPKEPMSIILNLGLSTAWSVIQWANIVFPVEFQIDYVRLYQAPGETKLTCDPKDYPTSNYIKDHLNAYKNQNLTTWEQAGYKFPKNKLTGC